MRVQSISNNQNQYKQNFGASVKALTIGAAVESLFGKGPVAIAKPLIKNLAGDDVLFRVAHTESYGGGLPVTAVTAETIRNGKTYMGEVYEYVFVPFKDNVVEKAQEALAQMKLKIATSMDVKTEERLERLDKLKMW